ncbi:hypothetical protein BDB01DRAFT_836835 [Pilobolus umbonatus]|nr:hypothetical protein BDB01DRAFT_836835 [Pilobolus umbonatus]
MTSIPPYTNKECQSIEDSYERLSREIEDFAHFVQPTANEQDHKRKTLEYIEDIILPVKADAAMEPFGSYVTGLQFPNSDIDINVDIKYCSNPKRMLRVYSGVLKRNRYSYKIKNVFFVGSASIGVIKVSMVNGIEVDITCNNDIQSSKRTEQWLSQYPDLRPLFMVLKFALSHIRVDGQRNFSCISAAHGGLASFTLICLIVSFLQLRAESVPGINDNNRYAMLLLNFLEYYSTFKTTVHGISLKGEGALVKPSTISNKVDISHICIENPDGVAVGDPNVARATSKFHIIQYVFRMMHEDLSLALKNNSNGLILPAIFGRFDCIVNKQKLRIFDSDTKIYSNPFHTIKRKYDGRDEMTSSQPPTTKVKKSRKHANKN